MGITAGVWEGWWWCWVQQQASGSSVTDWSNWAAVHCCWSAISKCGQVQKACVGGVTEIGTDVEARKRGHSPEQQPTTILLVEPPPAQLLLQPPQQPTHSLLAREASVSYQIARGLNSEMDLFSEGESKTQEAGAQHSLKQGWAASGLRLRQGWALVRLRVGTTGQLPTPPSVLCLLPAPYRPDPIPSGHYPSIWGTKTADFDQGDCNQPNKDILRTHIMATLQWC